MPQNRIKSDQTWHHNVAALFLNIVPDVILKQKPGKILITASQQRNV